MAYMSMNLTLTDLNNKFDKIASIQVVIIKPAIFDIMTMLQMTYKIFVNQATLKKMLFPVQRPGDFMTAEWELFFLHLAHFFLWSRFHHFLIKKKKKEKKRKKRRFCGRPTGHNFGHPLHRKQTLFKGGLRQRVSKV